MITGGKSFVASPPAFSNDAKRLLVCTGNTVSVFSTSTGLQISELEGHGAQVTSVIVVPASSPASKLMCYCWTASLDGKIKYWDFAAPELMTTIDIGSPIHSMVIPSLLSQSTESNGKLPDLFAYIYTEDVKQKEEKKNCLCGQIQKCNLTKSRIVGGVTFAKTRRPGSITSSPSGKYIGTYEKRKLRIWEIPEKDSEHVGYKKIRLHHTKSFTALAFHPTERVVAAGDVTGRILIWRGVGHKTCLNDGKLINGGINKDAEDKPGVRDDDDADSCTTWHWHSSQVNVLFFSSDGAYLYSGGREGVLVVWQLDTGKKKFLPRMGSPLLYFVNSPDPSLSSISRADNQIQLLRMPSMEILRSISGIKPPSSHMEIYEGFGSGVVFNHTSGLLAVPTENYRVQFYNLFDDREISEVQIYERNHQPGDEITVKVNLVALSPDGSTMSTVETRLPEEGIGSLVSLKFWACGAQNKHFSLSTVIYEPHGEGGISSIAFRPTSHMAVSSSYSGDFKVWVRRHDISMDDQTVENGGWRCHAVGSYKKKPMTAAAFSGDGSVLAVAAEKVITLWDPDRNTLLAVIGDSLEPITTLSFVGRSEYLVSASRGSDPHLTIWSMSKLSVACSVDKSTFAVLALIKPSKHMESTEDSLHSAEGVIMLFNVENPVPLSTWFVSKAQGGGLSFVRSSPKLEDEVTERKASDEVLAYINGAHEYVLMSPYGEQASNFSFSRQRNFSSLEEKERFGYASIYGELPEFSLKIDQTPFPSMSSEKTWKTIFSGPSHSLPPLPKLCSDFLESLLERRSALVEMRGRGAEHVPLVKMESWYRCACESVLMIQQLLVEGPFPFTFDGKHYSGI
ncbi:U3 small nucleolar RNA-associated protein 17 [Sesamum alatum]|uniref:U3 small nucleolar RNA-associated protein 17 n=1 Tax=Sesamum alatum TaxID=300844 RepID=A0AAE2CYZ6_9LAMI|nr:U3 small nucleolar RNA-associated protein 17 [Sesamum alatum]